MTRRRLGGSGAGFVLPLLVVMLVAFDLPLGVMLAKSLLSPEPTLEHYATVINGGIYWKVLYNTFEIAAITTAVCALLGYPLAYWMRGLKPSHQLVAVTLVVLPFWVSVLVRTYAWIVLLGNDGVVNRALAGAGLTTSSIGFIYNRLGVTIGTTNILLPFLVLPLFAAMLRIDERLLQAAASLGASRRTIFWRVFFPLSLPSLAAGCILVLILTLGFYVTPAILGGGRVPMIANMIDLLINQLPNWEVACAISTLLLAVTLACYAAYRRVGAARA